MIPLSRPDKFPTEQEQDKERLRLFKLMEALITWENSNNREVIAKARERFANRLGIIYHRS